MATSKVTYLGDLRTECIHLQSGTVIHTDAPLDNRGKGEKFSPTDLVATAYASCFLSIVAMYCDDHGYTFKHGEASVTKIMDSNPRRIGKIEIVLDLSGNDWDEQTTEKVIRAGKSCPVAKSISETIEIDLKFNV